MAVFYPHAVRCACGETSTAPLADGINAGRDPQFREQILKGEFHRLHCGACGQSSIIEKSFFYIDMPRDCFILVKPRQDRHLWRQASAQLEDITARIPSKLSKRTRRALRVVFGLSELREKLVAQDLGIDDRGVEYLKVRVLHEHPFLMRRPRLRLALEGSRGDRLAFVAGFDLDDAKFRVEVPAEEGAKLANDTSALAAWAKDAEHRLPIDETPGDYWVNVWRWSPQPKALDSLKAYAAAVRDGGTLDPEDPKLFAMLARLPRGEVLPTWAKLDLEVLFREARRLDSGKLQDAMFEVRFAKPLDDEWAANSQPDDIETLWRLMAALPPSNVEGNAAINEIRANTDDGMSWYEPTTHDIYISSRLVSNKENFEDVVRHEIGHGVYEDRKALCDDWLEREFGWKMWSAKETAGVEAWVDAMGGWAQWGVSKRQRAEIAGYVKQCAGRGNVWYPGIRPNVPIDSPWWRPDFGPRLACERTPAYWYSSHASWYRRGGKAFFVNYWYATVAVVNEAALDLVSQMPSDYAAMSPFEFFAELYALYFDLDDPQRGVIPQQAQDWLAENLASAFQPTRRPAAPARKDFEDIRRPDSKKKKKKQRRKKK